MKEVKLYCRVTSFSSQLFVFRFVLCARTYVFLDLFYLKYVCAHVCVFGGETVRERLRAFETPI